MPIGVPKSGHRQCRPRVDRVVLSCEACGGDIALTPGELRRRVKHGCRPRFCGKACEATWRRKPGTRVLVTCSQCGAEFEKRADHVHERNYCCHECSAAARRIGEGPSGGAAKWRDREYIRQYMRKYVVLNRERHNERTRQWACANRDKRNENQRRRRGMGHGRGFMGRLREQMIAQHGDRCLCCGTSERVEVDHVVPVSRGGPNDASNVQPLCRACNASKGDRTVDYRQAVLHVITVREVPA